MRFEVYDDTGGSARWRLVSPNGQTVASSGQSFASTSSARRAAEAFRANAPKNAFEVYEDAGGGHRWRATSPNGQTVGSSGEAFASLSNARRAADNVQAGAAEATGP